LLKVSIFKPSFKLTGIITAPSGDATTTLYLEATRDGKFPIGILTSTVDKFIRGGTTTEYVTQVSIL
jgi:hypothetical protein